MAPAVGRGFFPWISHVTPFTLLSGDQFLSEPPPALTSRRYARDYDEVQELGRVDSATRTPEQTNLALFFADNALRMWNRTSERSPRKGDRTADKARLYAEINIAGADAIFGCWAGKYGYQLWRPEAAITTAFDDGNRRTPPIRRGSRCAGRRTTPTIRRPRLLHRRGHGRAPPLVRRDGSRSRVESIQPAESPATGLIQPTLVFHRFSEVTDAVEDARMLLGIHFRFAWSPASSSAGRRRTGCCATTSNPSAAARATESTGND